MAEEATYRTETANGTTVYHCVVCQSQGTEHHTSDFDLMCSHQAIRHGGQMVEATEAAPQASPEHPHGGPPGQTGEHPDHPEHPHGGPPGQTGDYPEDEAPTHPIVEPDGEPQP